VEVEVVDVAVVLHGEMYTEVCIVNVGAFHIHEELLVEVVLKFMSADTEALER